MKLLKKALTIIGKICSFIYSYKIHTLFSYFISNYIYTGWIKGQFKKCGDSAIIRRPLFLTGGKYISVGKNFRTERSLRLEAFRQHNGVLFTPSIKIGDDVSINYDCHITAINEIVIGNGVLIASKVFITDHFHGSIEKDSIKIPPSLRLLQSKGAVNIHDNVWIGEGVCIMPNITIGEGCIIGANSVVTKSFPAASIIAGNPARIIKKLN